MTGMYRKLYKKSKKFLEETASQCLQPDTEAGKAYYELKEVVDQIEHAQQSSKIRIRNPPRDSRKQTTTHSNKTKVSRRKKRTPKQPKRYWPVGGIPPEQLPKIGRDADRDFD